MDIRFLKHIVLVIELLLDIIAGKFKETPGKRQHMINTVALTRKQLKHIISEAEDADYMDFIRKGITKEAAWKP